MWRRRYMIEYGDDDEGLAEIAMTFRDNAVLNPAFGALTANDFDVITRGWQPPSGPAPPTNLRIVSQ